MPSKKTIKPEDAEEALDTYRSLFQRTDPQYELDEFTRYVFKYCQKWMTNEEQKATLYLAFLYSAFRSTNQRDQKYCSNQAKKVLDADVESLVKGGEEA